MSSTYPLSFLAQHLGGVWCKTQGDPSIKGVSISSKEIRPGFLFAAVEGVKLDGHAFIDDAFGRGAAAALVSRAQGLCGRPGIVVGDVRSAVSRLAALFSGNPSREMVVCGITGTNGKTTIHWLLFHLLNKLGMPCMRIGTLGIEAPGVFQESSLTTPDGLVLHDSLRRGREGGMRAAVMEVSSHGLEQRRVEDISFDIGIFTNLTRDHLDYHSSFEAYFAAKARLFELLAAHGKGVKAAVINIDNDAGRRLAAGIKAWGLADFTYGSSAKATVKWSEFSQSLRGIRFTLNYAGRRYHMATHLIGRHNAENIAALFAAALALGIDGEEVAATLAELPPVPGRLEAVGSQVVGVYVDYAHTPDALEHALNALRPLVEGQLWVVFGCGGDRDRGKRPQMAAVACRLADQVVVTSDNPRTEEPEAIIADILKGGTNFALVEPDRRKAIEHTLRRVRPGDVVLIAGKGHEDYQIIGTEKIYFSDQEEVRRILGILRF